MKVEEYKMEKKVIVKGLASAAMLAAGVLSVDSIATKKVDAASGETPMHAVATVKYNGKGKVRLLDGNGHYQNRYLNRNTKWKTFAKANINGQTMYRLGSDKQWIPAQYTNLQEVSTNSSSAKKADVVTIKYVPGYGIAVWTSPSSNSVIKGKTLKHNTSWKFFKEANGNDGYVWYNLGGNQWISSRYTSKAKRVAETNSSNTNQNNNNKPAQPAKPANPGKTDGNKGTITNPSKPNTGNQSTDDKPTQPSKPAQPAFNKAEVEQLLMQKISNYRMSSANVKSYSKNPFKTSSELKQLADTRLEEQKVAYGHVRPSTGKPMTIDDYQAVLPNLNKSFGGPGFASAAENVTAMPEAGNSEEDADILFRSWLLDIGHRQNMMMDLSATAYGAVSVMRDGSTLVAVFEGVGR